MTQNDNATQEIRKLFKQLITLRTKIRFWLIDVKVSMYRFLNLDHSKVLGYPMTRKKHKKWLEKGDVRYFECDSYQVCRHFDSKSPHLPYGNGYMTCQRDSGNGFKCGQVNKACLQDATVDTFTSI